ncbi:hypothetical protein AIIKEEIJ_00532 [Rhodococcus sp. YH1]|nr:hypothetical protein [Rhodococcus sp. YH1]
MAGGRHSVRTSRDGRSTRVVAVVGAVVVVVLAAAGVGVVRALTGGCDTVEQYSLAVAPSIEPAVSSVLSENADTHCYEFTVDTAEPGDVAGLLGKGIDAPDLWIPDARWWASRAAPTAAGPVQMIAGAVASTPAVLVGPPGAVPEVSSWRAALAIPDLVLGNPLRTGVAAAPIRAALAETQDDPVAVGTVRTAMVPLAQKESIRTEEAPSGADLLATIGADGIGVATEQQVLAFTTANESALEARVPDNGSILLEYPVVVTSPVPDRHHRATDAARVLIEVLGTEKALDVFHDHGFRGPDGEPLPDGRGIGGVPLLSLRDEAMAEEALGAWSLMALPIRTLVAIDVSGSMRFPAGDGTRMDLTVRAALAGNAMFPDSVSAGLWAFSQDLGGDGQDYLELVPIRRYDTDVDGRTQREVMAAQAEKVPGLVGGGTGLYDTTLAAFRAVQQSYDPRAVNSVIVLTDGANEDPDSITEAQLLEILAREQDPARPVIVVTIGITEDADAQILAEISRVTGGSSYVARDPADIANVFVNALADRGER